MNRFFTCCAILLLVGFGAGRDVSKKNASRGEFPWMVSLRTLRRECGGALVSLKTALTACQCITYENSQPIILRTVKGSVGVMGIVDRGDWSDDKQVRAAHKFVAGKSCEWISGEDSTLLLKADSGAVIFEKPFIPTETVRPVSVASFDLWTNMKLFSSELGDCFVTGWGLNPVGDGTLAYTLKVITFKPMADMECAHKLGCDQSTTPTDDCVKGIDLAKIGCAEPVIEGETPCHGDEGSPYVCFHEEYNEFLLIGTHTYHTCGLTDLQVLPFLYSTPKSFDELMTQAVLAGLPRIYPISNIYCSLKVAFTACQCITYEHSMPTMLRSTKGSVGIMGTIDRGDWYTGKQVRAVRKFVAVQECEWRETKLGSLLKADSGAVIFATPFTLTEQVKPVSVATIDIWASIRMMPPNEQDCFITSWGIISRVEVRTYTLKVIPFIAIVDMKCIHQLSVCGLSEEETDRCLRTINELGIACAQSHNPATTPCRGDEGSPYVCYFPRKEEYFLIGTHTADDCLTFGSNLYMYTTPRSFEQLIDLTELSGHQEIRRISNIYYFFLALFIKVTVF